MTERSESPGSDRVVALAYLDGELSAPEAKAFELRLAREPALVAELEALAQTEAVLRAALGSQRRGRFFLLASAAVLLLALGLALAAKLGGGSAQPIRFDLALVETAPSDIGLHELLGVDPDWLPAGMGYRSDDGAEPPQADQYAETLEAAFQAHVAEALEQVSSPHAMRSFVIALEPERRVHALVLTADDAQRLQQVFPARPPATGLLDAQVRHLLPRSPIVLPDDWASSQRVDYGPGVLTRRGVAVLVALRAEGLGSEEANEWDELLVEERGRHLIGERAGSEALEPLSKWLKRRGFTTQVLTVAAP